MHPPFSTRPPATVAVEAATAPVYNPLLSLSLLTATPAPAGADAWVIETAGRLRPQQRRDNRLVFEGLSEVLVPDHGAPDFPTYLDALAAQPPGALRKRVSMDRIARLTDSALQVEVRQLLEHPGAMRSRMIGHLRMMWDQYLAAEWRRHAPGLSGMTNYLNQYVFSQPAWSNRTAGDAIRSFVRHEVPDDVLSRLIGIRRIVFVLSPHAQLWADRFGSDDCLWVFVKQENQIMRQAPIKRAEVLRPLTVLADDTRLRILEMLAEGDELRAQDMIARLGVSQPNVSRHLKQLVGAGLIAERRAGDATKLYRLDPEGIGRASFNLSQVLSRDNARIIAADEAAAARADKARATQPQELRPYLDPDGRVARWPNRLKEQESVIRYLAAKIAPGREYTEKELGALLREWFLDGDVATARRAMYDLGLLDRTPNGAKYWRLG
jgi:DNA-binding transcriptional ArsR family regulator